MVMLRQGWTPLTGKKCSICKEPAAVAQILVSNGSSVEVCQEEFLGVIRVLAVVVPKAKLEIHRI